MKGGVKVKAKWTIVPVGDDEAELVLPALRVSLFELAHSGNAVERNRRHERSAGVLGGQIADQLQPLS